MGNSGRVYVNLFRQLNNDTDMIVGRHDICLDFFYGIGLVRLVMWVWETRDDSVLQFNQDQQLNKNTGTDPRQQHVSNRKPSDSNPILSRFFLWDWID